ncbi:MAG: AAA family ATPase [Candidatus Woesearchaeota archaeon]
MTDLWYKKLGFYANPFSIKPGMYDTDLIAYDLSSIFKLIDKGELVFIEGEYGTGKTTILKNIISNYRGKNKIIYYSFNLADNSFDVNTLLEGAKTFFKKIVGLQEKNIIFLLDEVHLMKSSEAKSLIKPYKDGVIKSIVFVTHDYDAVTFPEEINKLLKNNIIKTVELNNKEAIALVRKRIGNIKILDDKSIIKIFEIANKNPRRLLEYCEDVLRFTVEIGDDKVSDYHIEEVLKEAIKEQKRMKKLKSKKAEFKETTVEEEISKQIVNSELQDSGFKNNEIQNYELSQKKEETIVKMNNPSIVVESIVEKKSKQSKENLKKNKKEKIDKEVKEKKFKVNKLIPDGNKNTLGAISEKEEEKTEYKVYYLNE